MDTPEPGPLEIELEALKQRMVALEAENEALRRGQQTLEEKGVLMLRFFESADETIAILDKGIVVEVNPRVETMFGYAVDEAIGKGALAFIAPASRELVAESIRSGNEDPYEAIAQRKDGSTFIGEFRGRTIPYKGHPARVTIVLDVTARKRVEQALREAAMAEEAKRAQSQILAELSTPLLPIGKGVILMPLVGELNAERAGQVLEILTHGVVAHHATIALLDITGVPTVDTTTADMLLGAARAARMLGARVVLTGIRSEVAQTFVQLDVHLGWIDTFGTLEQGVSHALGLRTR